MEKIDLTRQVVDRNGVVKKIFMIKLEDELEISFSNFIDTYQNYVDPKDAEIARLKTIIDELKNPIKTRKTRTRLQPDEWKEVKDLIRKGISNTDISREYGISDSSVSKKRTEMRKFGEKV